MPPHSFFEWVVGQNVVHQRRPRKPRPVFNLELETDDESNSDILKVTYPRTGRAGGKKVRFAEDAPKLAIKESSSDLPQDSESEVSTDVEGSGNEGTSDDEPSPDCPCTDCIRARMKLKRAKQIKDKRKQKQKQDVESSEDTQDDSDTAATVHARHKAKKAKQAKATKSQVDNSRQKGQRVSGSDTEMTDTTETETESEKDIPKRKGRRKRKKSKRKSASETDTTDGTESGAEKETETETETEAETTGTETEGQTDSEVEAKAGSKEVKTVKAKQGKKQKKAKGKQQNVNAQGSQAEEANPAEEAETSPFQTSIGSLWERRMKAGYPPYHPPPKARQGNAILPSRSQVTHIEHHVEDNEDPRPNAFFDHENGIMRVYHGQAYSNPHGALYPKRAHNQTLPVGTVHPTSNPWYNSFPTVAGQPMPPYAPPHGTPNAPPATYRPPAPEGAPQENQWFQGYGTTIVGKSPEDMDPENDFATGFDSNKYNEVRQQHHSPTPKPAAAGAKTSDRGGESNVIPSIEISPEKKDDNRSNKSHGSKTKVKKSHRSDHSRNHAGGKDGRDKRLNDVADMIADGNYLSKAREERLSNSNKSGSKESSPATWAGNVQGDAGSWGSGKKEPSPMGSGGSNAKAGDSWGFSNNNFGGDDWGANATTNTGEGGGNWDGNGTTNTGGGDWDANPFSNFGVDNWVNTSTSTNDNMAGGAAETSEGNTGTKDSSNNRKSPPPINESTTSMPGGWASPTRSNASDSDKAPAHVGPDNVGGNWRASNKGTGSPPAAAGGDNRGTGWGDVGAAQSSGGFFDNEEEQGNGRDGEGATGGGNSRW
ncbi:hypothetical protein F4779DRAFT_345176 [Xylariaceae sp. FL0662B]|nr:hypothetical protein F4779DRAFT_345176 [Xylariaceae sp. FL0662B]